MRWRIAAGVEPEGSTFWFNSTVPVPVFNPTSRWAGLPLTSSSATTNTSPRASSTTGVPVIPTVGVMSPQGSDRDGTGDATCVDHTTAPVVAERAYTVSFSVATKTRPPETSGSP